LLWIDDETLMYGASEDLWTMPADGSGEPGLYLSRAVSPVVLPSAPSIESAVAPTDMSDPVATDLAIDADATVDGDTITFTMTVTNHGPQDATDVRLGGALPDGLTFASFGKPTVQPTDGYGCTFQGGFASCTIGRLEVDANWSNSFTATVATTASVSTRFTVSATESDLEPNNSRLTVETP
jgi:uncharacterized repeat protein (TIGR01451 family)